MALFYVSMCENIRRFIMKQDKFGCNLPPQSLVINGKHCAKKCSNMAVKETRN